MNSLPYLPDDAARIAESLTYATKMRERLGQEPLNVALAFFHVGLQMLIKTQGHEHTLARLALARGAIEQGSCCGGARI